MLLASKLEEQTITLEAQRVQNDALKKDNDSFSAKMQDMEQTMSELIQATDKIAEITRQNTLLTRGMSDRDQIRSQLDETSRRLEASVQDNRVLSTQLENAREAAEAGAARSAEEIETLKMKVGQLEEENEVLRNRTQTMERSISTSQPSGSTTNVQELRIFMEDATRENEQLKSRLRQVQGATARMFLSSSTSQTVNDDLRRETRRLTEQVQDLEQLTNQLQSSSEDGELQKVLRDVTHENEELKARMRNMRVDLSQLRSGPSSSQVEDFQREITDLKEEVGRLQLALRTVSAELEDDSAVPPPAYDEGIFDENLLLER